MIQISGGVSANRKEPMSEGRKSMKFQKENEMNKHKRGSKPDAVITAWRARATIGEGGSRICRHLKYLQSQKRAGFFLSVRIPKPRGGLGSGLFLDDSPFLDVETVTAAAGADSCSGPCNSSENLLRGDKGTSSSW